MAFILRASGTHTDSLTRLKMEIPQMRHIQKKSALNLLLTVLIVAAPIACVGQAARAQSTCGLSWRLGTAQGPGGYEICFDEARQRTVIFWEGKTLEWDGVSWTTVSQSGPPARGAAALVYDPTGQRCLLFGGYSNNGVLKDLWSWNGSIWTQLASAPSNASGRGDFAMAFDRARNRLVVHGGYQGSGGSLLGDTLEWDAATNSWQRWATGAIGLRYAHRMAFDEARNQIILHGGFYFTNKADTWGWNGSAWTQLSTSGPARYVFGMTYDSARQQVVLHGGTTCCGEVEYGSTWRWNGTSWAQCPNTGPARGYINMAYDRVRDVLVIPGGMGPTPSGRAYIPETWELPMSQQPSVRMVPQQYTTIQGAVNASMDGDIVQVSDGTYVESIDLLGKRIVVRSSNRFGATISAPSATRSVIANKGESNQSKLVGFRISPSGTTGGGALVQSNVIFDGCQFNGCSNETGGGALVTGGSPTFLACDFNNCFAPGSASLLYGGGGAIRSVGASPTIDHCEFLECRSNQNAAVLMQEGGGSALVRNSLIVRELGTPSTATAMYTTNSTLTVEACLFQGLREGAIFGWSPFTVRDTVFSHINSNSVLDIRFGQTTLERCSIERCITASYLFQVTYSGTYALRDTNVCQPTAPIFQGPWTDLGGNNLNASCPCAFDLDNDGAVSGGDLALLLVEWESLPGPSSRGDLTGDGDVDATDLTVLLTAWGSCS